MSRRREEPAGSGSINVRVNAGGFLSNFASVTFR